jgi:hypothetical protein
MLDNLHLNLKEDFFILHNWSSLSILGKENGYPSHEERGMLHRDK